MDGCEHECSGAPRSYKGKHGSGAVADLRLKTNNKKSIKPAQCGGAARSGAPCVPLIPEAARLPEPGQSVEETVVWQLLGTPLATSEC